MIIRTRGRQTADVMKLIQQECADRLHAARVRRAITKLGTGWLLHPVHAVERKPKSSLAGFFKPKPGDILK